VSSFSGPWCKVMMVFAASCAMAAAASAQGAAGAGTSSLDLNASANALPTAANASARPARPVPSYSDNDDALSAKDRLIWIADSTIGWPSLAWGVVSAGIGTAEGHPWEYDTHWEGFADRYGIRLSGVATSNVVEAGFGAMWGENPRYKPEPEKSFGGRVGSVVYQTFFTRRSDGHFEPAYARFIAIPGTNFMSNTWRVQAEADTAHALERTGYGFAGQMGANAFHEFWPSIKSHLHL